MRTQLLGYQHNSPILLSYNYLRFCFCFFWCRRQAQCVNWYLNLRARVKNVSITRIRIMRPWRSFRVVLKRHDIQSRIGKACTTSIIKVDMRHFHTLRQWCRVYCIVMILPHNELKVKTWKEKKEKWMHRHDSNYWNQPKGIIQGLKLEENDGTSTSPS